MGRSGAPQAKGGKTHSTPRIQRELPEAPTLEGYIRPVGAPEQMDIPREQCTHRIGPFVCGKFFHPRSQVPPIHDGKACAIFRRAEDNTVAMHVKRAMVMRPSYQGQAETTRITATRS